MRVHPVLLDSRPPYLESEGGGNSLLLLPVGRGPLIAEIAESARKVTHQPPVVFPSFAFDEVYEDGIRAACPSVAEIVDRATFTDPFSRYDSSDLLLLISPHYYPATGLELEAFVGIRLASGGMVRHLLAFESSSLGTKELVHAGDDGRVRRIQRYFDPVTWPFPAGVIASLVPVACLLTAVEVPLLPLEALRQTLTSRGIPHQDVPFRGEFLELFDEACALSLAERRLIAMSAQLVEGSGQAPAEGALRSPRATVHADARLVGPVLVSDGAVVEEGALVVGPAIIGPGARVGRDARVAQCVLTPGAVVPPGATTRHRVVSAQAAGSSGVPHRRHTPGVANPVIPGPEDTPGLGYRDLKAMIEAPIALLALVVLSPILAVMALLVKLTSPGPIFHGDRREGLGGRSFRCWKFRTMRVDADALQRALASQQQMDGPQFKMSNDPRVTRVGKWLRRLNVDELPQLANVVCRQMSFVGPRPSPFRENQICVPWRNGRLSVRPGITGLWQVCRRDRAQGDFHQWIQYDLLYVQHMSWWVDLKILVATVVTLGGNRPVALERIIPRAALPPAEPRDGAANGAVRATPARGAARRWRADVAAR